MSEMIPWEIDSLNSYTYSRDLPGTTQGRDFSGYSFTGPRQETITVVGFESREVIFKRRNMHYNVCHSRFFSLM